MYNFFASYSYKDCNGLVSFGNTTFELSYRRPYMSDIKEIEELISNKYPTIHAVKIINYNLLHR